MNRRKATVLAGMLLLALLLSGFVLVPLAYNISWNVVGAGGGRVSAGTYILDATVGQPVIGGVTSGSLNLCSGFWCAPDTAALSRKVRLPILLR